MHAARRSIMLAVPRRIELRNLCNRNDPANIIQDGMKLRSSIQALNDKYRGPLDKTTQQNTVFPFVFLLGNHSSGKSSFVNYLLNRKVQATGVAPTDDGFTIIAPGPKDVDRDGPSLVGDPDMGFSSLRHFGPTLIHHTRLKIRADTSLQQVMIVDSPGMIDSPMTTNAAAKSKRSLEDERGYDFQAVVRWYAERADVVLLFFDPDKPGTTGETLSVLTNSLSGIDHKLHIILNKADQFKRIHDFARAYGSLCWNLSKVIPRKDLPRIHTMCLPSIYQNKNNNAQSPTSSHQALGQGLSDLHETRDEVVAEVFNAPLRRQDNELTRLTDAVQLLLMHCRVIDELVKKYRTARWKFRGVVLSGIMGSAGVTAAAALLFPSEPHVVAAAGGVSILAAALSVWQQSNALHHEARLLVSEFGLQDAYQRVYARSLAEKDEHTAALWMREFEHIKMELSSEDLESLDRVKSSEMERLQQILEIEIPNLRRRAAPAMTSLRTENSSGINKYH